MACALLYPHSEGCGRTSEAHGAQTGAVQCYEDVLLQLPELGIGVLLVYRYEQGLLRHGNADVGCPSDAHAHDSGRTGTPSGVKDGVYDELLDPFDTVGGIEHGQTGHVLRTCALGEHGDLCEIVVGRDVVDDRHAGTEVETAVLAGDRVDRVGPERDILSGPLDCLRDVLSDGGIEPSLDVEHWDTGILAHRDSGVLGLLHVIHDRT